MTIAPARRRRSPPVGPPWRPAWRRGAQSPARAPGVPAALIGQDAAHPASSLPRQNPHVPYRRLRLGCPGPPHPGRCLAADRREHRAAMGSAAGGPEARTSSCPVAAVPVGIALAVVRQCAQRTAAVQRVSAGGLGVAGSGRNRRPVAARQAVRAGTVRHAATSSAYRMTEAACRPSAWLRAASARPGSEWWPRWGSRGRRGAELSASVRSVHDYLVRSPGGFHPGWPGRGAPVKR